MTKHLLDEIRRRKMCSTWKQVWCGGVAINICECKGHARHGTHLFRHEISDAKEWTNTSEGGCRREKVCCSCTVVLHSIIWRHLWSANGRSETIYQIRSSMDSNKWSWQCNSGRIISQHLRSQPRPRKQKTQWRTFGSLVETLGTVHEEAIHLCMDASSHMDKIDAL